MLEVSVAREHVLSDLFLNKGVATGVELVRKYVSEHQPIGMRRFASCGKL